MVEDNFIVALELADRVEKLGMVVDGPYASADEARKACEQQLPDAAILDVCLRGRSSVAVRLLAGRRR